MPGDPVGKKYEHLLAPLSLSDLMDSIGSYHDWMVLNNAFQFAVIASGLLVGMFGIPLGLPKCISMFMF